MKKRLGAFLLVLNMMLMISGCGNSIPDMSEGQMDSIGEYVAITLMKYDANHRSRLVDLSKYEDEAEVVEPEQEYSKPESEQTNEPELQEPEVIEPQVPEFESIHDFMGLPAGVTVTLEGMRICDTYPEAEDENGFFYLEASDNKKLVVLHFLVTNQSGEAQSLNFMEAGNIYRLKMGDTYLRNALTTMLLDDMVTYMGTLEPGDSERLVLLFEGEAEYANESQKMNLILKNESKTYTIQAN